MKEYNKTLEEGLKEFDEKFPCHCGMSPDCVCPIKVHLVKSFLTTFAEKIREGIVEEVEGMRNNVEKRGSSCRINGVIDDESAGGWYLQALDDLLAQLKKI